MLAVLLIVFREMLEAGLIVGIVLAATAGVTGRTRWIAGGLAAGVAGAALVAVFAGALSQAFSGSGQEIFNAAVLLAAVAMLSWHNLWMAGHAREMSREMKAMGREVAEGRKTLLAMAVVVAAAILREGSEVVLFLFGIVSGGGASLLDLAAGALGGVALGALMSALIYRGLLAIPTGRLFAVTNVLIALLAAGMAGQAMVFLVQANLIPSLGAQMWDTSRIVADDSLLGRAAHVLVGYSDRPMGVQLAAYLFVLVTLIVVGRLLAHGRSGPAAFARPT
jgi:high-affinity iron transporter